MRNSFFLCGSVGLCMEVAWTGLHSVFARDYRCMGQSSMLMFPIYGMASCIGPASRRLCGCSRMMRGFIYTIGIFLAEFSTGSLLRYFRICPWDYSRAPLNYKGLIRLDYAPLWFAAGLFFEEILADKP